MSLQNSLPVGCGLGCVSQVGFLALTSGVAALLTILEGWGGPQVPFQIKQALFLSWGITQWIALIPLIINQRAAGHSKTVQGMIISGCLGVLLSSACATMFLSSTVGK
jgi:hypothetical protein